MKDYLMKAQVMLEHHKANSSKWDVDDIWVEDSCLQLVDGVEACLRYVEVLSGLEWLRGHDLKMLCNQVEAQLSRYSWFPSLYENLDHMKDWHDGMMYVVGFHGDANRATKVASILESMIEDLRYFKPNSTKDISPRDRIQDVLDRNNTKTSVDEIEGLLPDMYLRDTTVPIDVLNSVVMLAVKVYKSK